MFLLCSLVCACLGLEEPDSDTEGTDPFTSELIVACLNQGVFVQR